MYDIPLPGRELRTADVVCSVGRALQQRFAAMQMSVNQLADLLEMEPGKAMHMLSGYRDFRICELVAVAEALGLDVEIKLTTKERT